MFQILRELEKMVEPKGMLWMLWNGWNDLLLNIEKLIFLKGNYSQYGHFSLLRSLL